MVFDHIGIFVSDIAAGQKIMSAMLPVSDWSSTYDDPGLRVSVCFGRDDSGIRYELVAPLGDDNPVSGVLKAGKNVLNHVAYRVRDIERAEELLRAQGALPMGSPKPAVAFGGARVMFLLTPLTFIIELIESEAPATG